MNAVNKDKIDFNRDDDEKKIQTDRMMALARGYSA